MELPAINAELGKCFTLESSNANLILTTTLFPGPDTNEETADDGNTATSDENATKEGDDAAATSRAQLFKATLVSLTLVATSYMA